jgi:DNA polymerase-3 subunit beta
MIRRTIFAAARESARFSMTGVLWDFGENQLKLVATDGRRLAVATCPCKSEGVAEAKGQTYVVPTKAMGLLERLLQDGEQAVQVLLRPNEALFHTDRAVISTRLVEGRYPNYQEVIPKKTPIKIPMEAGAFLSAVRQASIMTDDENKRVIFTFATGKLTMNAQGTESGKSKVEMPIEFEAKEPLKINFDGHFISEMLRVLPPDARLSLELVDAQTPALFRIGPDYQYVVMPLT